MNSLWSVWTPSTLTQHIAFVQGLWLHWSLRWRWLGDKGDESKWCGNCIFWYPTGESVTGETGCNGYAYWSGVLALWWQESLVILVMLFWTSTFWNKKPAYLLDLENRCLLFCELAWLCIKADTPGYPQREIWELPLHLRVGLQFLGNHISGNPQPFSMVPTGVRAYSICCSREWVDIKDFLGGWFWIAAWRVIKWKLYI